MKNAMVHFTMFEPYLKWCAHVKHKVKEANDLHLRVLTKLQTMELKGIIRARGIFYSKVHHVLLCAFKSKARGATQADVCTFLCQLKEFCERMQEDAAFLLDPNGERLFGDDDIVQRVYNCWCNGKSNRVLIPNLLRQDPETRDVTISSLQAYARTTIQQLESNSSEYLPGGKIYTLLAGDVADLSPQQLRRRKHFLTCPTTSDPMERVFAVFDYDLSAHSNLSMITASGMTCYRMNKTREWLDSLSPELANKVVDICRRMYSKTLRERKDIFTDAIEGKHARQLDKVVKAARSRFARLKQMLKYNDIDVILTTTAWRAYKVLLFSG